MPTYTYRAKDRAGNTVTGSVEADSENHAAATIREMGRLPMDIRPVRVSTGPSVTAAGSPFARYLIYPLWTGINIKQLALFYRQMSTLLSSGMTISEALRSVRGRARGRFARILAEMLDNVQRGGCLSDVISRYPHVFGRLQMSLVRVGESGGLLDRMFERIASYLEYEMKVRQMIKKAMMYPIVVMVIALVLWISLPHVKVLVNQGFGAFLPLIWPELRLCVVWIVGAIVLLKLVFEFSLPRQIWDTIKIAPPVVGAAAHKIAMSRFSRALALLYGAGMSMVESVSIAAEACANLALIARMNQAIPALQAGRGLTESLERTRAFSPIVVDMLATGEKTGGLDATLEKASDYMDDEVDATIHTLTLAMFVVALIAAGVVVAMLALQVYGGYIGGVLKEGGQ